MKKEKFFLLDPRNCSGRRPPRSERLKWILGGETPKI